MRTVPPQLVSRRRDIRNAGVFFNCSRAAVHPQSRRSHRCGLDSVSISYAILPSPLLLAGVAPVQLTSPPSRRVVWEDGMHLTPQHFQAQRRYHEEQTARTLGYMMPFAFGLSAITVDDDGLRNGTFSLVQARGVLPDGTVFHLPDADEAPDPVAVAERFSPTRDAHVVYLALARGVPMRPTYRPRHSMRQRAFVRARKSSATSPPAPIRWLSSSRRAICGSSSTKR